MALYDQWRCVTCFKYVDDVTDISYGGQCKECCPTERRIIHDTTFCDEE